MKYGQVTMGQTEAIINKLGGLAVFEALLRGDMDVSVGPLVKWIGTVKVSATTERFVAREKIREDSGEVRINGFNRPFDDLFLNYNRRGVVEKPVVDQELRYGQLAGPFEDKMIVDDLGGCGEAITTLAEIWSLLKKQPNGEEGALSVKIGNLFYVNSVYGYLAPVSVAWSGGWYFIARSFGEFSHGRHNRGGERLFHRNPSTSVL